MYFVHPFLVVGISGKKRHGKDTLANAILESATKKCITAARVCFADPLKREVAAFLNISLEELEALKNEPQSSERLILQGVGQSRMRENPNYWVEKWLDAVFESSAQVIVVPDLRYRHEVKAIKRYRDHELIRVNRIGLSDDDDHPSETALDNYTAFDQILINDQLSQYEKDCKVVAERLVSYVS